MARGSRRAANERNRHGSGTSYGHDRVRFRALEQVISGGKPGLLSAVGLAVLLSNEAVADEGGTTFWVSGQFASHVAEPLGPGWSLPVQLYYYGGSAPASATPSSAVPPGTRSQTLQLSFTPAYAFDSDVLGGQVAVFASAGVGVNKAEENQGGGSVSQTVSGATDVVPGIQLSWTRGSSYWLAYLIGNIPVGTYDSQRIANIGIGHAAIDAGSAYTYNTSSGLSLSIAGGVTYNFENYSTNYRNGIDSHVGWGVMQSWSAHWQVGLAGYVYYELGGDSGSGDTCGACNSRVASIGPQVTYTFTVAGREWSADLRAYYEFWAQNRLEGVTVFATLTIPLSPAMK